MALLDYHPTDVDDGRIQELFESDADTYGRPSLFARMLAHNPDVLEARQEYINSLLQSGTLDPMSAELAYVTVAVTNDCSYCVASHTERLVEQFELPAETIDALVDGDETRFDERERAIISFARAAASDPKRVDESDIQTLRNNGFEDADVIELVTLVGAAVSANYIADSLNILPQDQSGLDQYDS